MIIRQTIRCLTCQKLHVTRVGMGQDERQSHTFLCRGCKEPIRVTLVVNYENLSATIEAEENAELAQEEPGATIVNLDANFLIPENLQGVDRAFPRLAQSQAIIEKAIERASALGVDILADAEADAPGRRPDFADEWKLLRKAWSLNRNGQGPFSRARIKDASSRYYKDEPLVDLADWLWRFARSINQPMFEPCFLSIMEAVKPVYRTNEFKRLISYYSERMSPARGAKYFSIINEYFNAYSEFSQVHFLVSNEMEIPADHRASSEAFHLTSMFYGNAFEVLADSIDILAFLNNLLQGRPYDQFEKLTLKKYYELDKSARSGPFATLKEFAAVIAEFDNTIRNASHHRGVEFCVEQQALIYRAGKGGQGGVQSMSYVEYLSRCAKIFQQILVILRIELIFADQFAARAPL